jgi:hypothetical protein
VSLNFISNAYLGNLSFVLHYANTTRITCANFTIAPGEVVGTASGASVIATATIPATTTVVLGANTGPAGWPTGVPYPPTAAPGWPSGAPFNGNGLGGWGAWGFGQAPPASSILSAAVAAGTGLVGGLSASAAIGAAGIPTSVIAAVSGTQLPDLPGTVTGTFAPKGTGLVPNVVAVQQTNDGTVSEWSNTLLSVAGLFALTLIM